MLRNIIIAIIAIIVLYFILSWAGIIGGADVPEAVEPATEAPATEAPATN